MFFIIPISKRKDIFTYVTKRGPCRIWQKPSTTDKKTVHILASNLRQGGALRFCLVRIKGTT